MTVNSNSNERVATQPWIYRIVMINNISINGTQQVKDVTMYVSRFADEQS